MSAGADPPPLRIGLSCSIYPPDPARPIFKGKALLYVEQSMVGWVMRTGALGYLLPALPAGEFDERGLRALVRGVDGLVLTGGTDVAPESYGEEPLCDAWRGDAVRDAYEIELVRACLDEGTPLFGVCRGAQLLNVALGGTLYQDLATQVGETVTHRDAEIYDELWHRVDLTPGSRLQAVYGGVATGIVNSVHHQAVKDLAPGLVVEARSPGDGVIEAIRLVEHPRGYRYAAAVQWHPEFQRPDDRVQLSPQRLLEEFLEACRRRRAGDMGP